MLGNGLNIYLIYSDIMSKRNPYPSSYNRDSQAEKQPASNSFRQPQKAWRMPLSATNSVMFFSQQMPEIRYDRVIETYDQQCPASIAPDSLYEILKHAYVKSLMENQHLRKRLGSLCKWTLSIFLELYTVDQCVIVLLVQTGASYTVSTMKVVKLQLKSFTSLDLIWLKTNENYN